MSHMLKRTLSTEPFITLPDDEVIICRCEEITKGEIRRAVYDGMMTMNEVKRYLRSGMGPCQGQSCARRVRDIIALELGVSWEMVEPLTVRNPQRSVPMKIYANDHAI